jgi:hypothetical protein
MHPSVCRDGICINSIAFYIEALMKSILARIIHQGDEDQGKYGKQGWPIT